MSAAPGASDPANDPPMRVLRVLTRANLGGPTRQVIALWHAHRQCGVATLLVTGIVGPQEVALRPDDHGVPRLSLREALDARGDAAGWVELPDLVRGVAPLADRRAGRVLRALIASYRPDVVHTHTSKAGLVGRRAAWAMRVPRTAHTFHGHVLQDYFGRWRSALLRRLEARLAARTDLLFAVSGSCADELASLGVAPRPRIEVVPPAVAAVEPLPRAEARERLGIAPGERRIVAVGRLVPIKRLEHFVAAVRLVPGLSGDIVGEGPERALLASLAASVGERVALRGAVADIAALLAAYDAVVLPSVREGLPLVAVEAFRAGVPVLGYDVPGVRDALAELGRGLLVPEREGPAGLARALERLFADRAATAAMVTEARTAVRRTEPQAVAGALRRAYGRPD